MSSPPPLALPNRIISLDQFRGYTIFGMFLVNYMSSYKDITPNILLHHHTYTSYADLIMPHFLFCVGFAFRLTFGRRDYKEGGPSKAYWRVVRRILGLMLVTFSVYHARRPADSWEQLSQFGVFDVFYEFFMMPWKSRWSNTLGQIALTSLWILPWLRTSVRTRIMIMVASGCLHMLGCYLGYFTWVNTGPTGVDGGPLGFLTWTIPALLGTITCDWVVDARESSPQRHAPLGKMFFWSIIVMLIGWLITFPARTYEITPPEMAELKENLNQDSYRRRDHVNGAINELNKPLNEKLKPFNKVVGDLAGKVKTMDFETKQEIVARMMKEQNLNPTQVYPTEEIFAAAVKEWETKYVENYEGELGELHKQLDYYQEALKPAEIELSDSQEAEKTEIARLSEEILIQEFIHKQEIRDNLMTEVGLDPKKDEPTEEIKKQMNEKYAAEQESIAAEEKKKRDELKPTYLEKFSPYHAALEEAKTHLPESAEESAEEKKKKAPEVMLVEHLETLTDIDWNSVANYGWRDLKLAENPVTFSFERYMALPLEKKIGRNPMERPPYEDRDVIDYNPRDSFYWNAWMMSQRAGTVSYPTFAAGVSLLMYLLFYIACDMRGWQV
ncbi:MAG: DUF5009 domain-containing protein, partial [Planctomycetaceae bacterium]|nr:DUF5009 domain-containing protein [Planctomycetaceae bacterium]